MHDVAITDLYVDEAVWPEGAAAKLSEFLTSRYDPVTDPILVVRHRYLGTHPSDASQFLHIDCLTDWEQDSPTLFEAVYGRPMSEAEVHRARRHAEEPEYVRVNLCGATLAGLKATACFDVCVACLRPTDDLVDFWSEIDWCVSALVQVGLTVEEAQRTIEAEGRQEVIGWERCSVCMNCQKKLDFRRPKWPGDEVWMYAQPVETMQIQSQLIVAGARVEAAQTTCERIKCGCGDVSFPTELAAQAHLIQLWADLPPGQLVEPHPFVYECEAGTGWWHAPVLEPS